MKNNLTNLKAPMLISLAIVFPFIILELVNRRNFQEGFPIPLFSLLWLLPMIFIVILTPIVRNARAGKISMMKPAELLLRVVFLVLLALFWGGILTDQIPCFLGVPNCD